MSWEETLENILNIPEITNWASSVSTSPFRTLRIYKLPMYREVELSRSHQSSSLPTHRCPIDWHIYIKTYTLSVNVCSLLQTFCSRALVFDLHSTYMCGAPFVRHVWCELQFNFKVLCTYLNIHVGGRRNRRDEKKENWGTHIFIQSSI